MPETHPKALTDCPGQLDISPHAFMFENFHGWRCLHCLVYGRLFADGRMTYEGKVHKATAAEIRARITGESPNA